MVLGVYVGCSGVSLHRSCDRAPTNMTSDPSPCLDPPQLRLEGSRHRQDVMNELELGPNGALLYAMEYIEVLH